MLVKVFGTKTMTRKKRIIFLTIGWCKYPHQIQFQSFRYINTFDPLHYLKIYFRFAVVCCWNFRWRASWRIWNRILVSIDVHSSYHRLPRVSRKKLVSWDSCGTISQAQQNCSHQTGLKFENNHTKVFINYWLNEYIRRRGSIAWGVTDGTGCPTYLATGSPTYIWKACLHTSYFPSISCCCITVMTNYIFLQLLAVNQ